MTKNIKQKMESAIEEVNKIIQTINFKLPYTIENQLIREKSDFKEETFWFDMVIQNGFCEKTYLKKLLNANFKRTKIYGITSENEKIFINFTKSD